MAIEVTGEGATDGAGDRDDGEHGADWRDGQRELRLEVLPVDEHLEGDAGEGRETDEQQAEEERRLGAHAPDLQEVARHEVHEAAAFACRRLLRLRSARRVRRHRQVEERYAHRRDTLQHASCAHVWSVLCYNAFCLRQFFLRLELQSVHYSLPYVRRKIQNRINAQIIVKLWAQRRIEGVV